LLHRSNDWNFVKKKLKKNKIQIASLNEWERNVHLSIRITDQYTYSYDLFLIYIVYDNKSSSNIPCGMKRKLYYCENPLKIFVLYLRMTNFVEWKKNNYIFYINFQYYETKYIKSRINENENSIYHALLIFTCMISLFIK